MAGELSRCGHPADRMRLHRALDRVQRRCLDCQREKRQTLLAIANRKASKALLPTDAEWLPLPDPERVARFAAWSAGLDDAISAIRAAEGFDGREREWQTLGEYLPEPPAPDPSVFAMPPVVTCDGCGVRRWKFVPCRTCRALRRRAG